MTAPYAPLTQRYKHHFRTRESSERARLQVNGRDAGWIVARPGAQVDDTERLAAEWLLEQTHDVLPLLLAKLHAWRTAGVVPAEAKDLFYCYFMVPPDAAGADLRRTMAHVQERLMEVDQGVRGDAELPLVDTAIRTHGTMAVERTRA